MRRPRPIYSLVGIVCGCCAPPLAYCSSDPVNVILEQDFAAHQSLLLLPLLLFAYYFVAWFLFGRDPKAGTVVPLYHPPANLSPAAVRYILMAGTDHKSVAAVLLQLAVKRCIAIEPEHGRFRITRMADKGPADLAPEELLVFQKLFHPKSEFGPADLVNDGSYDPDKFVYVRPDNAPFNSALVAYIQRSLTSRFEGVYFTRNFRFVALGGGLSVAACLLIAMTMKTSASVLFFTAWFLFGALIIGSIFAAVTVSLFKDVLTRRLNPWRMLPATLALGIFGLGFVLVLRTIAQASNWTFSAVLVAVVVLNIVWACLLRAPTERGRQALDQIAGFRQFLTSVELDRLKALNTREEMPGLLNEFFPYAVALDLKEPWADDFSSSMLGATTAK